MRIARTYSFDPVRDKDILDHLDQQPNTSAYIRNLIALDMGMGGNVLLDKVIRKMVEEYLQKSPTIPATPSQPSPTLNMAGIMGILQMKEDSR